MPPEKKPVSLMGMIDQVKGVLKESVLCDRHFNAAGRNLINHPQPATWVRLLPETLKQGGYFCRLCGWCPTDVFIGVDYAKEESRAIAVARSEPNRSGDVFPPGFSRDSWDKVLVGINGWEYRFSKPEFIGKYPPADRGYSMGCRVSEPKCSQPSCNIPPIQSSSFLSAADLNRYQETIANELKRWKEEPKEVPFVLPVHDSYYGKPNGALKGKENSELEDWWETTLKKRFPETLEEFNPTLYHHDFKMDYGEAEQKTVEDWKRLYPETAKAMERMRGLQAYATKLRTAQEQTALRHAGKDPTGGLVKVVDIHPEAREMKITWNPQINPRVFQDDWGESICSPKYYVRRLPPLDGVQEAIGVAVLNMAGVKKIELCPEPPKKRSREKCISLKHVPAGSFCDVYFEEDYGEESWVTHKVIAHNMSLDPRTGKRVPKTGHVLALNEQNEPTVLDSFDQTLPTKKRW